MTGSNPNPTVDSTTIDRVSRATASSNCPVGLVVALSRPGCVPKVGLGTGDKSVDSKKRYSSSCRRVGIFEGRLVVALQKSNN